VPELIRKARIQCKQARHSGGRKRPRRRVSRASITIIRKRFRARSSMVPKVSSVETLEEMKGAKAKILIAAGQKIRRKKVVTLETSVSAAALAEGKATDRIKRLINGKELWIRHSCYVNRDIKVTAERGVRTGCDLSLIGASSTSDPGNRSHTCGSKRHRGHQSHCSTRKVRENRRFRMLPKRKSGGSWRGSANQWCSRALRNHDLTIGAHAKIRADILAKSVIVRGTVIGTITAGHKVIVSETGSIEGDIISPQLALADGAVLKGRVDTATRRAEASNVGRLAPVP
jgi:bactofilin